MHQRNEVRSGFNQMMGEAETNLAHIENLLEASQQQMGAIRAEEGLLAEGAAESVLSSARMEVLFASLLMICKMAGLGNVAKSTFGQGLVPALVIAVLLSSLVALGVKLLLGRVSAERKNQIKWMVLVLGLILTGVGLVGFVVLRAEIFNSALMDGKKNVNQISVGNLLLMTGLTLGVPVICRVLYKDAHEKMNLAKNSLGLYREREELVSADFEKATQKDLIPNLPGIRLVFVGVTPTHGNDNAHWRKIQAFSIEYGKTAGAKSVSVSSERTTNFK